MDLELLLALFAFAVPGALFMQAYDWGFHKQDRPLTSTLGYGIVIGLFVYAGLQAVGSIDYRYLLEGNTLSLWKMLRSENIRFFLALSTSLAATGALVGRQIRPHMPFLFGWRPEAVLIDVSATVMEADRKKAAAVIIKTKTGVWWYGRPHILPSENQSTEWIAISSPKKATSPEADFEAIAMPIVLVPLTEIESLQFDYEGAPREPAKKYVPATVATVHAAGQEGGQPPRGTGLLPAPSSASPQPALAVSPAGEPVPSGSPPKAA